MEPLVQQKKTLDERFLQKRVLQMQKVLSRTSALQEELLFLRVQSAGFNTEH